MSIYLWALLIVVFFIGVTVWMRKEQRDLHHLLQSQAQSRNGQVTPATVFRYPVLRFTAENTVVSVSAMPNSGASGYPGEFTYVDFVIDRPTTFSFQLQARNRSVQSLIDGLTKRHRIRIENFEFCEKFAIYSDNQDELRRLMTADVQTAVLAASQPLDIQFDGNRFSLTAGKVVKTEQECKEVIDIGVLFLALLSIEP